jgi:predicted O-methyltransferase YrrM
MKEIEFTPPSSWCENPQWWNADDNESTEHEVTFLVGAFVKALQPEFVVETGTAFGHTTQIIGQVLLENGHGKCVSIDTDGGRLDIALERCKGLPVEFWGGPAADYTPTQKVDFAWIDSGPQRAAEIEKYFPYFSPGAIIGIHDAGPQHEVWNSLQYLIDRKWIRAIRLRTPRGVAFAQILND